MLIVKTVRANFEFLEKLGVDLWCFHDRDIAPEGKTIEVWELRASLLGNLDFYILTARFILWFMLQESNANLDEVVALAKELQVISLKYFFSLW